MLMALTKIKNALNASGVYSSGHKVVVIAGDSNSNKDKDVSVMMGAITRWCWWRCRQGGVYKESMMVGGNTKESHRLEPVGGARE